MQKFEESLSVSSHTVKPGCIPVSVIIPTRNEARHLARCLEAARRCSEIYVVDSQSTDATLEIARAFDAKVVQFHYQGGWPKKRQWALDTLRFQNEWILLLDADEILTPEITDEIEQAVRDPSFQGYRISLRLNFLGKELRFGDNGFWKSPLFRLGKGHFECRLKEQDHSMADIEVHEHVVIDGPTGKLKNSLLHDNAESLARYIAKHNEYSNWEARVWLKGEMSTGLAPLLFGTQAQRRRWLKKKFLGIPGSPLLFFIYKYLFGLGFLDGVPGLVYCGFQAVQVFHIKSKIVELRLARQKTGNPTSTRHLQ